MRWPKIGSVFPSAAYRASADLLIDQDDFVRKALSFDETIVVPPPVEVSPPPIECGPAALKLVQQAVKEVSGPLSLAKVASMLLSKIEGLDASSWAGFGSFRSLIESLDLGQLVVTWEAGGTIHDPRRHALSTNPPLGAVNGKTSGLLPMVVDHMVGFKEFGVCLELFKPEGSNADTPKRARMIKYAGTCPICAAQVLLDKGEPDFPRRIVGRCQESPREHVYSFDRATRTGYRLR